MHFGILHILFHAYFPYSWIMLITADTDMAHLRILFLLYSISITSFYVLLVGFTSFGSKSRYWSWESGTCHDQGAPKSSSNHNRWEALFMDLIYLPIFFYFDTALLFCSFNSFVLHIQSSVPINVINCLLIKISV